MCEILSKSHKTSFVSFEILMLLISLKKSSLFTIIVCTLSFFVKIDANTDVLEILLLLLF
jgi:hypothetical protein